MRISEPKRSELVSVFGEERVLEWESQGDGLLKQAEEMGLESKDLNHSHRSTKESPNTYGLTGEAAAALGAGVQGGGKATDTQQQAQLAAEQRLGDRKAELQRRLYVAKTEAEIADLEQQLADLESGSKVMSGCGRPDELAQAVQVLTGGPARQGSDRIRPGIDPRGGQHLGELVKMSYVGQISNLQEGHNDYSDNRFT